MKRFFRFIPFIAAVVASCLTAEAREVYSINSGWKFFTYNERDSTTVNLPHTWNNDALAGLKGYYRGQGNYLKYIEIKPQWKGRRIFIRFDGASTVADLMINGRHVGQHAGGSSGFVFEITDHVDFIGRNLFWVAVNNAERTDVLPTAGEENVYGGLFRGAQLIVADVNVIGFDRYGSDGVTVRAADISDNRAEGDIGIKVNAGAARQVRLEMRITDADGNIVASNSVRPRVEKGVSEHSVAFSIDFPRLWNGTADPYLYGVTVKLVDGQSADSVRINMGLRSFSVDPKGGFLLNGKPYPLHGVILRRDRATYGPAALPGHIEQDVDIIREMGANAVRVAGGAHSREFYDLCDRYGIIVVNDLAFTGSRTLERKGFYNTDAFRKNADMQLREMVLQLYNHPCIVAWSIFTRPEMRGDDPLPLIRELNKTARALDPRRLTAGTSTRDGEVNALTDLVIFHHSYGWTEGRPEDIGVWAGQMRTNSAWSNLRPAISYFCGGSVHQQQEVPERPRSRGPWHPEGWQTHFHEVYFRTLDGDSRLWAVFAGDIFDYGSVRYTFGEGVGVNDTGLVTFDRQTRKDAFYLYKANWNPEDAFVHIVGKRIGTRKSNSQTIRIYSNQPEVELFINGHSIGTKSGDKGVFIWEHVIMKPGDNELTALAGHYADHAVLRFAPDGESPR